MKKIIDDFSITAFIVILLSVFIIIVSILGCKAHPSARYNGTTILSKEKKQLITTAANEGFPAFNNGMLLLLAKFPLPEEVNLSTEISN